jgi:acetolactate decarboxylase
MDREESMAHIAVKISSLLESVARDLSTERKTSLDNLVSAALSEYLHSSPRRMYQISTSTALVEGVYGGSVPSSTLLENGDFGLGTFEGLDGEMVTLDGEIYQAAGSVRRRSDDFFVPFATITHFRGDAAVPIEKVACLKDIELACDPHRISENLFYALRVDGVFDTIHARAVHPVPQGSRLLHAAKTLMEFHFNNVEGTLVYLWSPKYSSSFQRAGVSLPFYFEGPQKRWARSRPLRAETSRRHSNCVRVRRSAATSRIVPDRRSQQRPSLRSCKGRVDQRKRIQEMATTQQIANPKTETAPETKTGLT